MPLIHLQTPRLFAAALMAVWLSGAVLLLCCTGARCESGTKDYCPMAKMAGHCDKAESKQADAKFTAEPGPQFVECCSFLPAIFDKTRKAEVIAQSPVVAPDRIAVSFAAPIVSDHLIAPLATPIVFRAQHKIFARNCVFRI